MPGQTCARSRAGSARNSPSMEGRAIARPNRGWQKIVTIKRHWPSMEGRAIARPNLPSSKPRNWPSPPPSMEGRAIARPNKPHSGPLLPGCTSFNGGPGNCPAKPDHDGLRRRSLALPSMEGRAIARPNPAESKGNHGAQAAFNGGPGNCPAKPPRSATGSHPPRPLQWRAGQLPGQTRCRPSIKRSQRVPSMEGRAIARPNGRTAAANSHFPAPSMEGRAIARPNGPPAGRLPVVPVLPSMEGRAIARPNVKHTRSADHAINPSMEGRAIARPNRHVPVGKTGTLRRLQWRAGQLPGQTSGHVEPPTLGARPSMEGRAIARPNLDRGALAVPGFSPSMEGRAIARPNLNACMTPYRPAQGLQWRAGQLPGQTCTAHGSSPR